MHRIRVGAGVLNQTPLDWNNNRDHIVAAINDAREQGVQILCLPELCIPGYGCEDAFQSVGTCETSLQVLGEILPETRGIVVSIGIPLLHRGALYNTACLISDGRIKGFVGKQNLAGDGLHYEPRWFKPWPTGEVAQTDAHGSSYPLGDLVFDCGGIRLGFEICEDAWVADRPGGQLSAEGAQLLLNPSASHFAFGKHHVRRRFVLDGSRAFYVAYVYANLLGNEAGRAIYDGDAMIASCGKLLATGPRFSFRDYHVTSAVVDIDQIRIARARANSFKSVVLDERRHVQVGIELAELQQADDDESVTPDPRTLGSVWESSPHLKEEEFTRALALGLFDYLRKSRSHGFIVSLSGGADSAACATLCGLMAQLAEAELGRDGMLAKLAHIASLRNVEAEQSCIPELLTCVYQSTRNSSSTTREAARAVATQLPSTFLELDVDEIVKRYTEMVAGAIGRPLTWEQDDLALQNIQARSRGPSVWMLANIRGALLLATSNRSEAAVGYATMDGDTCGGLSPIAGIDKAFLREWLRWMESTGPVSLQPMPSLALVNCQDPTAELRPLETGQTDEADLMPYELLDAIERLAIRDKQTPIEVFHLVRQQFTEYSKDQLGTWVDRFFRLWCRNQWKRERYAPSFHLDDENLDPKTWCRFPILSGGYERELQELAELIKK